jgi:hypothetical protein
LRVGEFSHVQDLFDALREFAGFHGPEPLLREPARAFIEIRMRRFG